MDRLAPADKYRVQTRVCAGMAEGSPSPEIRRLWLELARHYDLAADAVRPRRAGDVAVDPDSWTRPRH